MLSQMYTTHRVYVHTSPTTSLLALLLSCGKARYIKEQRSVKEISKPGKRDAWATETTSHTAAMASFPRVPLGQLGKPWDCRASILFLWSYIFHHEPWAVVARPKTPAESSIFSFLSCFVRVIVYCPGSVSSDILWSTVGKGHKQVYQEMWSVYPFFLDVCWLFCLHFICVVDRGLEHCLVWKQCTT